MYFLSTYAPTAALVASACESNEAHISDHADQKIVKTLDIVIPTSMFPVLSYYTTILTLLFSAPAVATGAQQLMPIIQRDGFSSKKAKLGVMHALINDITVVGALYNWWSRRSVVGFTPDATNLLVSVLLAAPATLYAAYLGGSLAYVHGVGFRNMNVKKSQ